MSAAAAGCWLLVSFSESWRGLVAAALHVFGRQAVEGRGGGGGFAQGPYMGGTFACARACARSCGCTCACKWDEACVRGAGWARTLIRGRASFLGRRAREIGCAAGVRRGGCAPRFAWGSGMVRAGIGVWGSREAGSASLCFKLS